MLFIEDQKHTSSSHPILVCISPFMASLQVDSTPSEDVITETEAEIKEPQAVAPPPPESVKFTDVEDNEDLEDFTAPPYEEKVENSDVEEENDVEYSPFFQREEGQPFRYDDAGEPAGFGEFEDDDDEDDDAIN